MHGRKPKSACVGTLFCQRTIENFAFLTLDILGMQLKTDEPMQRGFPFLMMFTPKYIYFLPSTLSTFISSFLFLKLTMPPGDSNAFDKHNCGTRSWNFLSLRCCVSAPQSVESAVLFAFHHSYLACSILVVDISISKHQI